MILFCLIKIVNSNVYRKFLILKLLISNIIVNAIVNKLTDVFAPYLKKKFKKKILEKKHGGNSEIEKQAYALEYYEVRFQVYYE